jgi:hypothetical protein
VGEGFRRSDGVSHRQMRIPARVVRHPQRTQKYVSAECESMNELTRMSHEPLLVHRGIMEDTELNDAASDEYSRRAQSESRPWILLNEAFCSLQSVKANSDTTH